MKKRILFLYFLTLLTTGLFAQKVINVDEAVGIALKNNFDILVARNDADIDKLNNTEVRCLLPRTNLDRLKL